MKFNSQFVVYMIALVVALACFASAASLPGSNPHLKVKRSPYLRLDELSTKIYLAKNKLGGGYIDPLEIGKRSASSQGDDQVNLAVVIYDGIQECISHSECSRALKLLLDS